VHFFVHIVVVQNLLEIVLVLVAVIERDGDSLGAKSARSTDSVEVVFGVAHALPLRAHCLRWHVEVNNDLDLGHVDTSS